MEFKRYESNLDRKAAVAAKLKRRQQKESDMEFIANEFDEFDEFDDFDDASFEIHLNQPDIGRKIKM